MSWLFSRALVAEYSEENCSDGQPSAPLNMTPTPQAYLSPDRMTAFYRLSRFGMTFAIDIFRYQRKMCVWTKNTDTAKSATALSAAKHLRRETKEVSSSAARTLAVVLSKQGRRLDPALSAEKHSYRLAQTTKRAPVNVEPLFAYLAGSLTQWSKFGAGLPCSAAHSLQDACGTRPTERHRFSGIRLRNYGRTLKRTSSQECRGTTTERGATNGA